MTRRNPFIAGSWVRGDNFFGRKTQLAEVLEGERDALWVVGGRRVGKTSLLKELEYRVQLSTQTPWAPLYWDLEGSRDARGLAEGLLGSVEDSESFRRATRVSVDEFEGLSVADLLMAVTRRTVRSGWRLLLLIDEAEELLTVAQDDPGVLPRLRRIFQRGSDVRAVLTSTRRLARLDQAADIATSPFLQGFAPPLYLTPLAPDEARELLARGGFARDDVELILARSACHPFLLQLIASRLFETPDARAVLEQVAADEMVANFFAVDFQTLEAPERVLLEEVARESGSDAASLAPATRLSGDALETHLLGLRHMGYLVQQGGRYSISNSFFERWLRRLESLRSEAPRAT
jgi:hypothetical protein